LLNRKERTRKRLIDELHRLESLADRRGSKDAFFAAIATFRAGIVSYLRTTKLINQVDIDKFDRILANIDPMKTKGHDNKVYWSSVGPEYDKAITLLNGFISCVGEKRTPMKIAFVDFLKSAFTTKSVMYVILTVVAILIADRLTGLFGALVSWLRSLFF
jgi:hypothetical protein